MWWGKTLLIPFLLFFPLGEKIVVFDHGPSLIDFRLFLPQKYTPLGVGDEKAPFRVPWRKGAFSSPTPEGVLSFRHPPLRGCFLFAVITNQSFDVGLLPSTVLIFNLWKSKSNQSNREWINQWNRFELIFYFVNYLSCNIYDLKWSILIYSLFEITKWCLDIENCKRLARQENVRYIMEKLNAKRK